MICPNCKAEYRAGFTHCTDCDVDLVTSLNSRDIPVVPNPPVRIGFGVLWRGEDPVVLDAITDELSRDGIPYEVARETSVQIEKSLALAYIGSIFALKSESYSIRVPLDSLTTAKEQIESVIEDVAYLFCPLCKAEIFKNFAKCEDCQSPLVSSVDQAENDPPVLVWRGTTVSEYRELLKQLQASGLPCHGLEMGPRWNLSYNSDREYALRVPRSAVKRAEDVLSLESGPKREEDAEFENATVEICAGNFYEESSRAILCALRDAKIDFEVLTDTRQTDFYLVREADESRARQIVHEVIEATQLE